MSFKALTAESIGTFAYVAVLCGTLLLGPAPVSGGLPAALAAGLTFTAMCFALGGVSGCHFNPAITLGLVAAGRFETRLAVPYVIAQTIGASIAAAGFWLILLTAPDGAASQLSAAANRFDAGGTFPFAAVMAAEALAAAMLLMLFVGATTSGVPAGFAPIGIGFLITALHLVLWPISHAALNPARATAFALFSDLQALLQLWVFWVAPILGAVAGGLFARWINEE
ncbi:MAG: aquaporin [Alphaproteobacteria bacterium]|nr:aquaporin [Alphaproteobacteria bacterium]